MTTPQDEHRSRSWPGAPSAGRTLVPGVYNAGGVTLDLTGTLTLDGQNDPNSVWIFQATSDLITASSSSVRFINGGQPCNVFWQVTSSATLGSGSSFVGDHPGPDIHHDEQRRNGGRSSAGPERQRDLDQRHDHKVDVLDTHPNALGDPDRQPLGDPDRQPLGDPDRRPSATPTASPSETQPATDTVATTDVPGSRPTPVILVGIFLLAVVVVVSRRSLRTNRTR